VADAPARQVVLIVEDEALVLMTAVDMIEEAGFEVLEPRMPTRRSSCWRPGATSPWSSRIPKCPDRWMGSGSPGPSGADGRPSKSSRHPATTSCVRATCRLAGCSCENLTALPRFPVPYGTSRPRPRTRPPATPPASGTVPAKKIIDPLETGSTFSSFLHAATSGPGALRGPGGDGRRKCPTPARTHLAQRRIWL